MRSLERVGVSGGCMVTRAVHDQWNLETGTVGNVVSCTTCLCPVQKQMLCDVRRMDAYYHAIMDNADCFKGKVVLDVGAGSGILAIW